MKRLTQSLAPTHPDSMTGPVPRHEGRCGSMRRRAPLLWAALAAGVLLACSDDRAPVTPDAQGTKDLAVSGDKPGAGSDGLIPKPDRPPIKKDGPIVPKDTAMPFPDGSMICNPSLGQTCGPGMVCNLLSCGKGVPGVCTAKPGSCPKIYQPVCGCDGTTYGNDCERLKTGVALKHTGACQTQPDMTPPKPDIGPSNWCNPGAGVFCNKGETCNILSCLKGASGTCTKTPSGCPTIYAPVCGCDGKTYGNDCERIKAGAALNYKGACQAKPDLTPPTPDAGPSNWCNPGAGFLCNKGETCNVLSCNKGASGTCVPTPSICPMVYAPVCGCNGLTYGNDCERIKSGVALSHKGAC